MRKALFLLAAVVLLNACSSKRSIDTSNTVALSGRIDKLGMSTFQYGTHLLKTNHKTYALKSNALNLNDYVAKHVTIKGTRVAGYPLENGPELVEVKEIKVH